MRCIHILSRTRKRLHGKNATEEETTREISRLLLSDHGRRLNPMLITETAKILGCSRATIYDYIKKAVEKYHTLEYKDGRVFLPSKFERVSFKQFDKNHHEIVKDPLVEE